MHVCIDERDEFEKSNFSRPSWLNDSLGRNTFYFTFALYAGGASSALTIQAGIYTIAGKQINAS